MKKSARKKSARKKSTKEIVNDLLGWKKVYAEDFIRPLPIMKLPATKVLNKNMPGLFGVQIVWYKKRFAKEYYKKCGLKCPKLSILWAKIEGLK